jgi:hypothetical protein
MFASHPRTRPLRALVLIGVAALGVQLLLPDVAGATASDPSVQAGAAVAARQAGTAVAIPAPESITASPATDVVLRGTTAAPRTVTGSKSGSHAGAVHPHPDGNGVTFHPDRPFAAGETVTVSTANPVRGASGNSYTFQVGIPAEHPGILPDGEIAPPITTPEGKRLAAEAEATEQAQAEATGRTPVAGAAPAAETGSTFGTTDTNAAVVSRAGAKRCDSASGGTAITAPSSPST